MFDKALIVLLALVMSMQCNALPQIPSRIHDVNSSLYWGTYRPALYFGTKTRSPSPLTTGLMWFSAPKLDSYKEANLRHACEQHDKLKRYGWAKHDGKNYGKQEIEDPVSKVTLTTEFIKFPGGKHGGEWALKIKGVPSSGVKPGRNFNLMYYVASEDQAVDLKLSAKSGGKKHGIEGEAYIKGKSKELGDFIFVIQDDQGNTFPTTPEIADMNAKLLPEYQKAHYMGVESSPEKAWKVKEVVNGALSSFQRKAKTELHNIAGRYASEQKETQVNRNPEGLIPVLPNTVAKKNQIIVIQKVLKVPFEVEIIFISGSAHQESISTLLQGSPEILSSSFLRSSLDAAEKSFDDKFEQSFRLAQKGYSEKQQTFAKFALSNLIGGIGYWHGSSIIASSHGHTYSEPRALYSAVPSRPFFPRGFLWDEGFHQLIISKWDPEITMEVVTSWLNSMDENGWMEREQILGDEARSKVPREFQTQFPEYANPPTLLFPIVKLAEKVLALKNKEVREGDSILPSASHITTDSKEFIERAQLGKYEEFLSGIIDRVELNFQWFLKTQNGESPNTFRWRGRTVNHSLTSGLDDYPREGEPTVNEHHLDLLCWMAHSASALSTVSKALGRSSKTYDDYRKNWLTALDEFHWNAQSKSYADLSTHIPEKNYLVHDGYISLFPLLLGLLPPDSPKLEAILDVVKDPAKLWSQYGILSLSRQDAYFGTHENYWRGAIWININYLILSSLHNNYVTKPGPYQEKAKVIYNGLRTNIIENMFKNYESTGYIWEQYNPQTGAGQRSHPFTGWSSLVLLIMAESY